MRAGVWLLVLLSAASCGPYSTLDRTVPVGSPTEGMTVADVPVRGFEVVVRRRGDRDESDRVEGELLAIDEQTIWVEELGVIRALPRAEILEVTVADHETYGSEYIGLSLVGGLSTISNGVFLLVTAPLWLFTGAGVVGHELTDPGQVAEPDGLDALFQWARYPQGLPTELIEQAVPAF